MSIFTQDKNPRGIPRAPFIENVEAHLGGPDVEVEPTLKQFQDALAKYRYMDSNMTQRRQGLEEKIPDIKKTLAMVDYLQERREGKDKNKSKADPFEDDLEEESENDLEGGYEEAEGSKKPLKTTFELNDTLYAEAELEETDTVYLWLGANVMLSYPLPAAQALLRSKLSTAESSLLTTTEDLEFLREQVTVMEVNTARVYNWDVKRRRERRERGEGGGESGRKPKEIEDS